MTGAPRTLGDGAAPVLDVAYIALGSNLGDRAAHLSAARAALAALPGSRVIALSRVEETAPLDASPQEPYLNQMIVLETTLRPRELLEALLEIERGEGRVRTTKWAPRTLDLDIVQFEGQTVTEPDFVVPHPELPNRDFWRRELAEVRLQR
ncbi:MAG: 2-amino-4-hydroxy-6-hydroxymethyldihydropteridine diphosphokinase [Anaerolineae bacterium]|nr:2-amino-4-hydroxy-6-hydroxymethyldihydropteridine diphosphokinase [Gemmatimonadaceae bacterium]